MTELTKQLKKEWEDMLRVSNPKTCINSFAYKIGEDNVGMFLCHGNRLNSINDLIKELEEKCEQI